MRLFRQFPVLVLVLASLFLPRESSTVVSYFTTRTPLFRIWEFFIGCTVGAIVLMDDNEGDPHPLIASLHFAVHRNWIVTFAMVGILALSALPSPAGILGSLLHPYQRELLCVPLFAILVMTLAAGPTYLSALLEHPWTLLLGESSYSLYMIQWIPLTVLIYTKNGQIHGGAMVWPALIAAATIGLSIVCYRYIETPARIALRERGVRGTQAVYARSSTGSLAASTAFLVNRAQDVGYQNLDAHPVHQDETKPHA
jgi:peptidoglycan/LPS O-acetylase OafA/YrhL